MGGSSQTEKINMEDSTCKSSIYALRDIILCKKKVSIFMLPKHKNDAYNKIYR